MLDPLLTYARRVSPPDDELILASESLGARGSSEEAVRTLTKAAERLDPFALCRLSVYYSDETKQSFNPATAFSLAKQAAELNYAPGQFLLAWYLENGIGAAKDFQAARVQYEIAAEHGYGVAAIHLALALTDENCASKDVERAVNLLSLAANNGDSASAMQLAQWYEGGVGVRKNYRTALKWYEAAAELGSTLANVRLSMAYMNGDLGVTRNTTLSEDYLRKSSQGDLR